MNTAFFVNLFLVSKNDALEGKQVPCLRLRLHSFGKLRLIQAVRLFTLFPAKLYRGLKHTYLQTPISHHNDYNL